MSTKRIALLKDSFDLRRVLLPSILALLAVGIVTFGTPQMASAGNNGQQLGVTACGATRVVISGKNQKNVSATYTLNKTSNSCGPFMISNWWWRENVTLTAYYDFRGQQTISVYVLPSQKGDWVYATVPTPSARQVILWRAKTWVDDRAPYNQRGSRDGYRTDCSGYVSFAWSLGQSYSGDVWRQFANQISFNDLQPGDALDNPAKGDAGHVMLFVGWVNKDSGIFTAYEENGFYGKTIQSTYTLNKSSSTIRGLPGTYIAIRKKGL